MTDGGTAWVFPGQGSQEVGMGRDVFEASSEARAVFERGDDALGRSISKLCFDGPPDELGKTANSQPAIFVVSLACLEAARAAGVLGEAPRFVAGHSLGEYSALAAAGAMSFEAGVRLVDTRGRHTQAAANAASGGMAAVLGLEEAGVQAVCDDAGVEMCNVNAPGQIVIGGAKGALARACALATERGARRAIPLDVDGAFHTSLMEPAVAPMTEAVGAAGLRSPEIDVVTNDTAQPTRDVPTLERELVFQLTHPVRWVQCVEYMVAQGVTTFVEIGPGRVLSGLIKRIAPGVTVRNINSADSLRV